MNVNCKCVSLRFIGLQVLWIIALESLTRGHLRGDKKELLKDSLMIVILYVPTVLAFGFALVELGQSPRGSKNVCSIAALFLSLVIVALVTLKWYHVLWLEPHGFW